MKTVRFFLFFLAQLVFIRRKGRRGGERERNKGKTVKKSTFNNNRKHLIVKLYLVS